MSNEENVLAEARANLWRGLEAVGGRLTLSDQRLTFRAHALNVQAEPLDIPVRDIAGTRKYRNMGFVPNGLAVTTKAGVEHRFAVWGRDRFIARISELTS